MQKRGRPYGTLLPFYTRIHEKQDNCLVLIAPTARWILMRRTDAQSAAVPMKISYFNGRVVLPQKWLTRVFLLRLGQGFAIIMPTEETALRFLRAAVAARFHKNGSFEPLLWNSAIAAMRISTGAPQRSRGRCKVLDNFVHKPCT